MFNEVIDKIKLLRQLLENIGLCTTKYADRCVLDIKDFSEPFYTDTFIIRRKDNWTVGTCSVYVLSDGSIAIRATVDSSYIPEYMVKELQLLGFDDTLTYRIIIEDTTDGNSTESTK